jgi:hypothetical protein
MEFSTVKNKFNLISDQSPLVRENPRSRYVGVAVGNY